ncbi:ankyrin repeat-containing domain protein [Podospora fimiseda]|uniref:Ankyrin repeat-containing domain protein n=1 Tax=Podospora fimiseda TaxID=252190 RepID=A0AAN7BJA7_9PEZI|nr:ankyrin repeat-containing domain protein [Podospora fimiseda]
MAWFYDLPTELVLDIGDLLDRKDLVSLVATSKQNRARLTSVLYRRDVPEGRALVWAAKKGQIETLEIALNNNGKLNHLFERNAEFPVGARGTPLHFAAMYGQCDAIDWLLDHGADAEIGSRRLCTCSPCDIPTSPVRCMGCWASRENTFWSWYPLHLALCYKQPKAFRRLLERGVPFRFLATTPAPHKIDHLDDPVLCRAAHLGDVESMQLTIEQLGMEKLSSLVLPTGLSPLEVLCYSDKRDQISAGISLLLRHGAQPLTNEGLLRLARCHQYHALLAVFQLGAYVLKDTEDRTLTLMLMNIIEPGIKAPQGWNKYRQDLVKFLVEHGAGNKPLWNHNQTPLMALCSWHYDKNCSDLIALFVKFGSDINARDDDGRTALHYLVRAPANTFSYGKLDGSCTYSLQMFTKMVSKLVSLGARLDLTDNERGLTPIQEVQLWQDVGSKRHDYGGPHVPRNQYKLWIMVTFKAMLDSMSQEAGNMLPATMVEEMGEQVKIFRAELMVLYY